jgi:DNA repair photolyase
MAAIYEPKGAAREYSPLALNYINGCDHGCVYCYVPKIMKRFRSDYEHSDVYIKEEKQLMKEVLSSAKKHANSPKQVFLSFLTDPYSHFNKKTKLTRRVLEILLEYKIPVSILSKGGFNVLDDLDVIKQFGNNIQVGGSLTFTNEKDAKKWEKNGALPIERFKTLEILHLEGVRTWASMEPVIYPDQSLEIMEITKNYIDGYKIGKLNHFQNHEKKFNWNQFLKDTVEIMRKNDKLFYIKEDLRKFKTDDIKLLPHEVDMDFMALKKWGKNSETTAKCQTLKI